MHDGSAVSVTMVNLPAVNTPQFDWVRTRLPRDPQPVPPIYQPELAAEAIVWAVEHDRREVNLGAPTTATLLADKVAPGLLDRYLARTGYDSQQTDRPVGTDRPDNLFDAVPGDAGARGRFDNRAKRTSLQWWVTTHRSLTTLAGIGALVIALGIARL
jgi:hypothetical protein